MHESYLVQLIKIRIVKGEHLKSTSVFVRFSHWNFIHYWFDWLQKWITFATWITDIEDDQPKVFASFSDSISLIKISKHCDQKPFLMKKRFPMIVTVSVCCKVFSKCRVEKKNARNQPSRLRIFREINLQYYSWDQQNVHFTDFLWKSFVRGNFLTKR